MMISFKLFFACLFLTCGHSMGITMSNLVDPIDCEHRFNVKHVYFGCIPTFNLKYSHFDICNSKQPIIDGYRNGFIHSPNYPNYYGNRRDCTVSLKVPADKRLILYLVRISVEDESMFHSYPNDYVRINGDKSLQFYGHNSEPRLVYEGNDRSQVEVNFKSDWITTENLRFPKGFLIYFEFYSETLPTTTTTTTTTSTTTTTTTTSTTTTTTTTTSSSTKLVSVANELIDDYYSNQEYGANVQSSRIQYPNKHGSDRFIGIIVGLVTIIGLLVLIIVALLFAYRSKQKQTNEEDTIYDVNDSKSMGSNVYNDDYTNGTSMMGCKGGSGPHRDDIEETTSASSKTKCSPPTTKRSAFNEQLKRMYSNINRTLTVSTQLLSKANLNPMSLIKQLETNSTSNSNKLNNEKTCPTDATPNVKTYSINEYNPNYVDLKCEKDLAIDRLKLYTKPDLTTTSTPLKKTNIERELEKRKKDYFDRIENQYVSGPTLMDSSTSSSSNNDRLEIYEVDFDINTNIAYIIPSKETSLRESSHTGDQATETEHDVTIPEEEDEEDAEIYQSINEADLDHHKAYDDCHSLINGAGHENVDKSTKLKQVSKVSVDETIYSAPTNKLIGEEQEDRRSTTTTNPGPVIRLMNHENNETHA